MGARWIMVLGSKSEGSWSEGSESESETSSMRACWDIVAVGEEWCNWWICCGLSGGGWRRELCGMVGRVGVTKSTRRAE